jgi:hypothetical protein
MYENMHHQRLYVASGKHVNSSQLVSSAKWELGRLISIECLRIELASTRVKKVSTRFVVGVTDKCPQIVGLSRTM